MTGPVRLRPKRPCPVCGKPSQQKYHPFCSARCAHVDLNRWLAGRYAVPAEEAGTPDPAADLPERSTETE
ncbi:MAG: DNA gyrase inhibitor YacG [Hyphomicrobiales bacterium]